MKLCFDSIEEVKAFVGELKGTRGKRGEKDEAGESQPAGQVPLPMQPPALPPSQGFPGAAGFAPPAAGAGQAAGAFPAVAATGPAPEVLVLVNRIVARVDAAAAAGGPQDAALAWFRGQCGPEAASATMDQIKAHFLPRLPMAQLENIAKQMGL